MKTFVLILLTVLAAFSPAFAQSDTCVDGDLLTLNTATKRYQCLTNPVIAVLGPDAPPASPNAMNDEFSGSSLDPKWTTIGVAATHSVALGRYKMVAASNNTNNIRGIWQAFSQPHTSGSATFIAKFRVNNSATDFATATRGHAGLFFKAVGQGYVFLGAGKQGSTANPAVVVTNFLGTLTAADAGFVNTSDIMGLPAFFYIKAEKVNATITLFWSVDGDAWAQSGLTLNLVTFFTADLEQVGIYYARNSLLENSIVCEWFRRTL
jgi:hypothetical protein